jgi:YidC/Oxa1 family membrane protein insertase
LLYPLSRQAIASQKALTDLQPKIKEIQKKYKNDKEEQAKAMMELYRKTKVNPFSGCLPFLIQIPILIALYRVFWQGFTLEQRVFLYSFVPSPETNFVPTFLGFFNLAQPNFLLAVIAGALQFWQSKMLGPKRKQKREGKTEFAEIFQKQMLYFFPFFTFLILLKFPSAIALYWITTSLFSIGQQHIFLKGKKDNR